MASKKENGFFDGMFNDNNKNSSDDHGFFEEFFDDCRRSPFKSSIKIALIGDGGTGKTSYFNRIASGNHPDYKFSKVYDATRGCNICQIEYTIGRYPITLHIFDTAGQEKFGALRDSYLMGADGIILMYDLTEKITKQNVLAKWIPEVKKILKNSGTKSFIPIAVVGNKNDRIEEYDLKNAYDLPGIRLTTLTGAYSSSSCGQIEHFIISVKSDTNLMSPINWLLKTVLAYIMPVNAKRTGKLPKIVLCNM